MRLTILFLASLALAACSSSNPTDGGSDVITPTDAPTDDVQDSSVDVASDVTADAASDAAPDVTADVTADAPRDVAQDAQTDAPEPFCDVPAVYTFGPEGGNSPYRDSSRIEPGRNFTFTRMVLGRVDGGAGTCTTMLPYCGTSDGGTVDTLAVINAFNHADVMAAFNNQTTTLYGRDTRPVDGQLFVVTRGDGRHFEIGADCGGASGCRAIPAGLARLRTVLQDLQTQQLMRPECAGVRP